MFQNYISVAVRNLLRHKLYSAINIGGLALGLMVVFLIMLFVRQELSFDSFWENSDRIYRTEIQFDIPGRGIISLAQTPGPLKAALEKDLSGEIQASTRLFRDVYEVTHGENKFTEGVDMVDPNFFEFFNFEVVSGNIEAVLQDNNTLMVAESVAEKYFGNKDVLGETILVGEMPFTIVAVMKDLPPNSHINSDMIALLDENRYNANRPDVTVTWVGTRVYTYFMLTPTGSVEEIYQQMPDFLDRNVSFNFPGLDTLDPSEIISFEIMPLRDIHLYSRKDGNLKANGNATLVFTIAGIAFLILFIAGINFINLSTARATQRAREVGIRKVLGAERKQLMLQFIGESMLMTIIVLVISVLLVNLTLPAYNQALDVNLVFEPLTDFTVLSFILGVVFMIGGLGGIYPALIMSGFRPSQVLHSNKSSNSGSAFFRNILVVIQFSISIGLIVATGVFYAQTNFATSLDMGYKSENIVNLRGMSNVDIRENFTALKQEFLNHPNIHNITFSNNPMPTDNHDNTLMDAPGGEMGGRILVEQQRVDFNFFEFFEVEPIAGRLFSEEFQGDRFIPAPETELGQLKAVVNETLARQLGYSNPEDAINKTTKALIGDTQNSESQITVIGVIPDLISNSARDEIIPTVYFVRPGSFYSIFLEISPENKLQTMESVNTIWNNIVPDRPIRIRSIEEQIENQYINEIRQANMFVLFSLFAVFISSIGLFGMAAFTAERKTKEIGVRKVLGAGIFDIVKLLVLQFSKPVLIAALIAWPMSYYFLADWLNSFTYRLDIASLSMVFVGGGAMAVLIAWGTVAGHALKAASANPIHAIRVE